MNLKDPKTSERIGVTLLAIILVLSGILLLRDKTAPIEFKEKVSTLGNEQVVTDAVEVKGTSEPTQNRININKAAIEDLDTLPGIGEKTAQKIIDYRTSHKGFKTLIELKEVSGIGDAKYNAVKDLISL